MDAVADRLDPDVVAVHPVEPGPVEVVGIRAGTQGAGGAEHLDRLGAGGEVEQPPLGVGHDVGVEMADGVAEGAHVVERDLAGRGRGGDRGQRVERPGRRDQPVGVAGVEPQLVAQPRLDAAAAIVLVLAPLGHLRHVADLGGLDLTHDLLQRPQRVGAGRERVEQVGGLAQARGQHVPGWGRGGRGRGHEPNHIRTRRR